MRILHLVHQYMPEKVGGTELYTRTLARYQVRQGHEVAIFTPTSLPVSDTLVQPAMEEGISVYRVAVGARSPTAVFTSTFGHQRLRQALAAVLPMVQPDLVHIQHLMGMPAAVVALLNQAGIPYLVTLHDYWYLCANGQLLTNYDQTVCQGPRWWLNCARCALARVNQEKALPLMPALVPLFAYRHGRLQKVLAGAQVLIAPTAFTAEVYAQMGVDAAKIEVVPHGIQPPAKMPERQSTYTGLHLAYIGGLSWQKGVHILIEAVNQLPASGVKLSIVGDMTVFPDYVAYLKQLARHPGIHFGGRLPYEQVWSMLVDSDLVVVPSLWYETASLIIQEAFAAGVPVVASRLGALQERVQDGVDGRLVPPGKTAVWRHVLYEFWQNPALVAELRAGIQPVRTIQEHCQDIDALYARLL